jgi:Acetyltransferase (GNAT) domain
VSAPTITPQSDAVLPCPIPFAAIPRRAWDRLVAATPSATPFSRWTFHRAWWDAYGSTAHEQYLAFVAPGDSASAPDPIARPDDILGIVPLMHRHEVEPTDAATATVLRRRTAAGTSLRPDAKAVFMAASYHADYATLLAAPPDLPPIADSLARACCKSPEPGEQPWDVIDLRRFRADDPAIAALAGAFRAHEHEGAWTVELEQEDVCPVLDLRNAAADWDTYLGALDKKARHEIRRKLRRAEAAGQVRYEASDLGPNAVEEFIRLHQARWGEEGLFPATEGGERSREFLHRLAQLEAAEGAGAQMQIGAVSVGDQVIFATLGFDDGTTTYFYNAGMDPTARDLSPGVTGTAEYIRNRLEAGRATFDFLRGNEPYKYEWGARDKPLMRLIVQRAHPA